MSDAVFVSLAAARWAQFFALFVLFGAFLFPFYVTRAAPAPCDARLAVAMRRAVSIAGAAQALSILVWLATSMASMGDGWASLGDADFLTAFFFDSSFGAVWLARLAFTALLFGVLVVARGRLPARNPATALALGLVGALLVSQAGIGHPAGLPLPQRLFVDAGYGLHLLGGAAWIGGLWPLGAILAELKRDDRARPYVEFVLGRFAIMASAAVALVVLGAAINIGPEMASLKSSNPSWWWRAAAMKIAMFGALIAIAYRNRFVLTPLLAARPKQAARDLLRNVIFDRGLAALVLAAAAFMGVASPTG